MNNDSFTDDRAAVKADLEALLNLGLPLETARRLAHWDISLEYDTLVVNWPEDPNFPAPTDGLRESVRLLVSRSSDRVLSGALQGNQLSTGLLYAVSIPDVPELGITQVEFFLDGVAHHTEFSAPWDYDGTLLGGDANRVVLAAGPHTINAVVTDAEGTFGVSAAFGVE